MIVGPAGLLGRLGLARQIAMIQNAIHRRQQRQGQRGIPSRTPAPLRRLPTADGKLSLQQADLLRRRMICGEESSVCAGCARHAPGAAGGGE